MPSLRDGCSSSDCLVSVRQLKQVKKSQADAMKANQQKWDQEKEVLKEEKRKLEYSLFDLLNVNNRNTDKNFNAHGSPDFEYCELPELQCACDQPAVRHIYHTETYERMCLLKCNVPEGCNLSIREDLLNKFAEDTVEYCTCATNSSLQDALASSVYTINKKDEQILELENKLHSMCKRNSQLQERL